MKTTTRSLLAAFLGVGLYAGGCAKKQLATWDSFKNPETVVQLKSFVAEKEAQANAATNETPSLFGAFFAAAAKGDWLTVSNRFVEFRKRAGQYEHTGKTDERLRGTAWQTVLETWGALDAFGEGDEKYSAAFGNDIIASIPSGSIYFGGTDPGRFIVTALCKSQVKADPFFVLTQNALADSTHLDYLRAMYGEKIYVPTPEDSQKCFQDYMEDAQHRMQSHQLMPGEDVRMVDGKVQVSGQIAVMNINGLMVKLILDKNPGREFYIEESFPFDWMYPYLEPHGPILKINRQPLPALSDETLQRDSDYWTKYVTPMIGGWLKPDTTIGEVAAFAEKIHVKKDLSGFAGDPQFVRNEFWCKNYSKLRSSIGGLYEWRAQHAAAAGEKKRMHDAADFAFRQAWALCPYSLETVFRYVNLLMSEGRIADAILVAETAEKMPETQGGEPLRALIGQLKQIQQQMIQSAK